VTLVALDTIIVLAYLVLRHKLHWLPIRHHVVYKLATLISKAKQFGKPAYLRDLLHEYQPEHSDHPQLIFYTNRLLLPHLFHVPSPLPLQLFETNCLLTLNLHLVSAPLNLVSELIFTPLPTPTSHYSASDSH